MDSSSEFIKLRQEILNNALPLLDSDTIASEDRFRLSLQIAQTNSSVDSYRKAFRIAEGMEGDAKLLAYLDLLGDIDYVIEEKGPTTEQSSARREVEPPKEEPTQADNGNTLQ